jgi:hypothetical protein
MIVCTSDAIATSSTLREVDKTLCQIAAGLLWLSRLIIEVVNAILPSLICILKIQEGGAFRENSD